ncbi:MAG: SlyX family protein [Planctomycetia bacterium]|nr:SlyX family protein [Planctomycetia bacterium]
MEERQRKLEERLTLCERLNDTLNEVVVDLQKRLSLLEREHTQVVEELRRLRSESREPFDPVQEKPPHY